MAFSAVVQLVAMAFCASTRLILPEQIAVWSWFSTGSLGLLTPVAFVAFGSGHRLDVALVPPTSNEIRWSYSVVLLVVSPYCWSDSFFALSVSEAGARTKEEKPLRQIVCARFACVTPGSTAPGVQTGSGRNFPDAASTTRGLSILDRK